MEGHKRRAQRLTQNIAEQPELAAGSQQDAPAQADQLSSQATEQPASPRRRRNVQPAHVQECQRPTEESMMPRLPDVQDGDVKITAARQETEETSGKEKKRLSSPHSLHGKQFSRALSASAKAGKTAIQGLGGLLVLAMLLAKEGLPKLRMAAQKLLMGFGHGREPKAANTQPEEPYELELIRPQDYHGRGQTHAQKTAPRAHMPDSQRTDRNQSAEQRRRAQLLNRLASAVLVMVALVSAWQIGSIVLRSVRTRSLNQELSRQRAAVMESAQTQAIEEDEQHVSEPQPSIAPQPTVAPQPTEEPQPMDTPQPGPTRAPDVVKTTKYHQMGGDALPEMAAFYEKNRDLVAWVQIPDVLDLPVVYRDNSYYLTRDFNKQKNAAGTIFLDQNHPFKEKTQNLLLHGHNMKDGTMFGRLAQYLYDDTYIRNHPFIYFDTLWKKEQYVIIAILNVSLDTKNSRFFNYFTHDTFSSDAEFQAYIRQLQLRSYYAIPIDVQPSDALLTLSTCLEEDRLVIVARRLRENETRSELRTFIRMATKQ